MPQTVNSAPTYVRVNGREVRLTHLDRLLWTEPDRITKLDYINYLNRVADVMLPYFRNRPLVVTRYPRGVDEAGFYQKNIPTGAPAWIDEFHVAHKKDETTRYIVLNNRETLLWLGNSSALELHPWLSTVHTPERPDRLVIDLDPAEGADFTDVVYTAKITKSLLDELGWPAYLKTSGASGLHIMIPIQPLWPYRTVAELARMLGTLVMNAAPDRVTLERTVSKRTGKVYFDYLQNGYGKTVVGPYSVRPLPLAPVSTPLLWDELDDVFPAKWTLTTVPERLRLIGDPMAGLLDTDCRVDPSPFIRNLQIQTE